MEDDRIEQAKSRTELASERNRLANERTFLAWVRTGLASVGGGVAMVQLLTFVNPVHKSLADLIGIILILLGIALFCLAYIDFRKTYSKLLFKDGYAGSILTITAITIILCLVSLVLLLFSLEALF